MPETYRFDDRTISWKPFAGFEGLYYHLLSVDHDAQVVDMLMKFDPRAECVPHRHAGPTKTLVLQGEHRLYDPVLDHGDANTVRTASGFGSNRGDETHIEGGGDEGAIILLMMTAVDGVIYEILTPDGQIDRVITIDDFQRGLERQQKAAA
ncbi:MAG: cupin domain-containing protein [Minwuia sp.]|uniref:cupin domain-containing protein n=1 Tax=Minwuia sp. TaxID=2493630 RepID=UPI003A8B289F